MTNLPSLFATIARERPIVRTLDCPACHKRASHEVEDTESPGVVFVTCLHCGEGREERVE